MAGPTVAYHLHLPAGKAGQAAIRLANHSLGSWGNLFGARQQHQEPAREKRHEIDLRARRLHHHRRPASRHELLTGLSGRHARPAVDWGLQDQHTAWAHDAQDQETTARADRIQVGPRGEDMGAQPRGHRHDHLLA